MGTHNTQEPGPYFRQCDYRPWPRRSVRRRSGICGSEPMYLARRHTATHLRRCPRCVRAPRGNPLQPQLQRHSRTRGGLESFTGRKPSYFGRKAYSEGEYREAVEYFNEAILANPQLNTPAFRRLVAMRLADTAIPGKRKRKKKNSVIPAAIHSAARHRTLVRYKLLINRLTAPQWPIGL